MISSTKKNISFADTYLQQGSHQLRQLSEAAGLGEKAPEILALFQTLLSPWGEQKKAAVPAWKSDVCDDHTPYEFSLALGGPAPELRVLVEVQASPPSLLANWQAQQEMCQRLAHQYQFPLDRLDAIKDIFAPRGEHARFGLWHAACFWPDEPPLFKVYLDAQAAGPGRAAALIEEALGRLGFRGEAWSHVAAAARRGSDFDEFKYFSIDLSSRPEARVKCYVRHHHATPEDIEAVFGGEGGMAPGEASRFCEAMTGVGGPYSDRPLFSCTALAGGQRSRASRTLYVPISAYATHDRTARERIHGYLAAEGLAADRYDATLRAFASRPLESGVGLHSYVGFRKAPDQPRRVTVYFSPEAHAVLPPRNTSGVRRSAFGATPTPEEMVRRHEHDTVLSDHPFFQRLGREPVDMAKLWLVMANFWEGVVRDFPKRLSHVVARVSEDAVRCVLAKQLNDELGEGDFERAHRALFLRLLAALEPFRMAGDEGVLLAPGRQLNSRLGGHFFSDDEHESIGALLLIEVYGKQVDIRLAEEFRRQSALAPGSLTWLHLHETLEVEHADDSVELSRLVPANAVARAAAFRGASGVVAASQAYFDDLYRLCFP